MLYKAMKNFLFLVALLPVTAAAWDSECVTNPAACTSAIGETRREPPLWKTAPDPMQEIRDRQRRSAIYDVWETDSQGHYHQYLVIPDEYGRPSRITPGLSSGR